VSKLSKKPMLDLQESIWATQFLSSEEHLKSDPHYLSSMRLQKNLEMASPKVANVSPQKEDKKHKILDFKGVVKRVLKWKHEKKKLAKKEVKKTVKQKIQERVEDIVSDKEKCKIIYKQN
jgi:flagellar hook-basal body complex protein FliE